MMIIQNVLQHFFETRKAYPKSENRWYTLFNKIKEILKKSENFKRSSKTGAVNPNYSINYLRFPWTYQECDDYKTVSFINVLLTGSGPQTVTKKFCGAKLLVLKKSQVTVPPRVSGNFLWRICLNAVPKLLPEQIGVGVKMFVNLQIMQRKKVLKTKNTMVLLN